jgi:hypothetical protein
MKSAIYAKVEEKGETLWKFLKSFFTYQSGESAHITATWSLSSEKEEKRKTKARRVFPCHCIDKKGQDDL